MGAFSLAIRNIRGNGIRSLIILFCVVGTASFFISVTLIVRGAEHSLDRGLERLGADIIVVPDGAQSKVETALLMGTPTEVWMSTDYLPKVANVSGVSSVSPQIYLQSLYGASCCAVSEMFLVVFDPETDFAITPWLERHLGRSLAIGEVIGGSYIFVPPGEKYIKLYGYNLTLRGNLEATGTGLDQTMFLTLETAQDMALTSVAEAERPLDIPPGSISSIMVKVDPAAEVHAVAKEILLDVLGVTPIESPSLFGTFREQMFGLLWGFLILAILAWALSGILLGLVFSLAANERRREMAILRALGASRSYVLRSVLAEAALLALVGGTVGILGAALGIYMFRDYIAGSLGMPFLFPSLPSMLTLAALGVLGCLASVGLAVLVPAWRASRHDPAIAMREQT